MEEEEQLKRIPVNAGADHRGVDVPLPPSGDTGLKEAELLGRNLTLSEIKEHAEKNEAQRNEKFRDHFELIAIISLWGFFIIFSLLILTWFWHYLTPESAHWLTQDQLSKVQTLATGGIVATIAAGHMKKRLG